MVRTVLAHVRDDTLSEGGLNAADLNPDSVGISEVDGSLTGSEITDGSLLGADIGDGALTGTDVADQSLAGADINESSLGIVPNANTLDGLDSLRFKNTASQDPGQCLNLGGSTACATTTLSALTAGDDVYLSAFWRWYGTATGRDEAQCAIKRSSTELESALFGQNGNEHNLNDSSAMGGLVVLDQTAPAGTASYSLVCSEGNGAVNIVEARIVAFKLSG